MKRAGKSSCHGGLVVMLLAQALTALAQESADAERSGGSGTAIGEASTETVAYAADFFLPYNPVNARDMIAQVPGFQIDEGGSARGFGGTAGNILINGERPSTKNDDAGAILSRIPANQVLRIDLIRGETGGLNLRGRRSWSMSSCARVLWLPRTGKPDSEPRLIPAR